MVRLGMLTLGMPILILGMLKMTFGAGNVGAGAVPEGLLGADEPELLTPVRAGIPAEGKLADGNGSGSMVGKGTMFGIGGKV